ncbi:MAG: hypothetical protein AAF442_01790 [Pseudomonadota bacterium]
MNRLVFRGFLSAGFLLWGLLLWVAGIAWPASGLASTDGVTDSTTSSTTGEITLADDLQYRPADDSQFLPTTLELRLQQLQAVAQAPSAPATQQDPIPQDPIPQASVSQSPVVQGPAESLAQNLPAAQALPTPSEVPLTFDRRQQMMAMILARTPRDALELTEGQRRAMGEKTFTQAIFGDSFVVPPDALTPATTVSMPSTSRMSSASAPSLESSSAAITAPAPAPALTLDPVQPSAQSSAQQESAAITAPAPAPALTLDPVQPSAQSSAQQESAAITAPDPAPALTLDPVQSSAQSSAQQESAAMPAPLDDSASYPPQGSLSRPSVASGVIQRVMGLPIHTYVGVDVGRGRGPRVGGRTSVKASSAWRVVGGVRYDSGLAFEGFYGDFGTTTVAPGPFVYHLDKGGRINWDPKTPWSFAMNTIGAGFNYQHEVDVGFYLTVGTGLHKWKIYARNAPGSLEIRDIDVYGHVGIKKDLTRTLSGVVFYDHFKVKGGEVTYLGTGLRYAFEPRAVGIDAERRDVQDNGIGTGVSAQDGKTNG